MKNKIIFFISIILTLIVILIPAKLIPNFVPEKSGIILNGLDGSIWSGKIGRLQTNGWLLSEINFSTQITSLIVGKLGVDVEVAKGDLQGVFSLLIEDKNNIELESADINIQLSSFEKYIPFKGIELNGQLETRQLNFIMVDSKPDYLSGSTLWNNGSVIFNGKSWQLGDFDIAWNTTVDGVIEGKINKSKNVLDLLGDIRISKQGLLEFNGSISTKVEKPIFNAFLFFADGKPKDSRQAIKFKKKIW